MSNHKVIGEGSYGCTHRPSLPCEDLNLSPAFYKDKVSKVMNKKSADEEMEQYEVFDRINDNKKNNYILEKPTLCYVNKNYIRDIENCSRLNHNMDIDDLKLLIMKDGGDDIKKFVNIVRNNKHSVAKEKLKVFWLDAINLLKGVQFLLSNNICHHDIKPQNIVYNPLLQNHKNKFIDFSLTENITKLIRNCQNNTYRFGMQYFNFPVESLFTNKNDFDTIRRKVSNYNDIETFDLAEKIIKNEDLLYFRDNLVQYPDIIDEIIIEYGEFLDEINDVYVDVNFDIFITMYFNKFDVYGLGLSLLYVFSFYSISL